MNIHIITYKGRDAHKDVAMIKAKRPSFTPVLAVSVNFLFLFLSLHMRMSCFTP